MFTASYVSLSECKSRIRDTTFQQPPASVITKARWQITQTIFHFGIFTRLNANGTNIFLCHRFNPRVNISVVIVSPKNGGKSKD